MARDDLIEMQGTVLEALRGGTFRVRVAHGGQEWEVAAHLGGKLRQFHIMVVVGDVVTVALSPYDMTRGKISFRAR